MTRVDREIINKLLSEARDALDEIRNIVSMDLNDFMRSRTARFSLRYSIIMLVEALVDLAIAILEKDFGESIETYREAFVKLAEKGVIDIETMQIMIALVSLRNMIVHRYWAVDDVKIYRDAKEGGVRAVESFLAEVLRYVEAKEN